MSNNRRKGHNYERLIAKDFKDMGYPFCKTSRNASTLLDACKVDIWGIPYNIQAKAGYKTARPKFEKIYEEIKTAITENFPEDDTIHKHEILLFHKVGSKEHENHVTVTYDFMMKLLEENLLLKKQLQQNTTAEA